VTSDDASLVFAQRFLTVIEEGRRTAMYKLAVLLALVDCCALGSDARGRPPATVSTRDLARRVVELYWPQVRPYGTRAGAVVLTQTMQRRAVTVDAVRGLHTAAASGGATTVAMAEQRVPEAFEECLRTVEVNLVRMPLGKLQRPAEAVAAVQAYPRFLHDDSAFREDVPVRTVVGGQLSVELQPGVPDWLLALSGLVRPVVELHWTRAVARWNPVHVADDGLRDFLFGSDRSSLAGVRPVLVEAQRGACFYCGGRLVPGGTEVDHFVPWSRVPNDATMNLVAADRRCNGSKRDHYAELDLLRRWSARDTGLLEDYERASGRPLSVDRSRQLAVALYGRLPAGTPV
jgi:5-methylcytosine-specific restriction endonuclease McrA